MPVQAINNVSFGKRVKNMETPKPKNQYYKWVSQNQANETLKMSLGREIEDGKYKVRATAAKGVGLLGMSASILGTLSKRINLSKFENLPINEIPKEISEKMNSARKSVSIANKVLVASAVILWAGNMIDNINRYKANKTAHERGFLSDADRNKMTNVKEVYETTEAIYNAHVE